MTSLIAIRHADTSWLGLVGCQIHPLLSLAGAFQRRELLEVTLTVLCLCCLVHQVQIVEA